jgi:hypothetical protein
MPQYVFEMEDGTERPVTDVCAECLAALTQMAGEFQRDLP